MIYLSKPKYTKLWQCPKIQFMEAEEAGEARRNLLEYCKLDTFAMVKIWQKLTDVCRKGI